MLNLEVDFNNLKYYKFTNISVGDWKLTIHSTNQNEYRITASALATINFQYALNDQNQISAHTFHNDNGHGLTVGPDHYSIESGSKFISSTPLSPRSPLGEMKVSFVAETGHLKRMRRATRPIFHAVSKIGNLTPGRNNVFFFRAENEGEELTYAITCTQPTWSVSVSPTQSSPMTAVTDIEISISVPHHEKSGTEALISLSASNGKTIVGSNSFTASVAEATPPTTRAIKVKTTITNRFAKTTLSALAENTGAAMSDAPFRAIIPSKAFVRSFTIVTGNGRIYKSKIVPAFEQNSVPDTKLKFANIDPVELTPEDLKKVEAETPLHHAAPQEVMLVDTIDAGDHRIVQVKQEKFKIVWCGIYPS